ncbi:hypothetical protein PHAVU_011G131100 [Phaseolus vulgaris]|uniref:Uncharacterized protein n=1 Tax=Phaseolus vulgaris TaxID=3885 RepID=V7AGW7_PHAVU|nr:hypothetical protein PHAVU_011G131100g [Phaseolus vulgaris]XP_007132864.1 hypothetical protein PHAVU_011G131100g [Phaseolus vulgaris]ESW04857.1 hypothetical protein PHAVU_011G131100g [Phaseolus vulgaris]ESW04858.1 hypothetical protein PHAVU_011G131100g [Phaseolus vulgaris]
MSKDSLTQKKKASVTITQAPTEREEETTSGLVFKRKRKATAPPTEHSHLDGRAPHQDIVLSEGHAPHRDVIVIQEGEAKSSKRKSLWDSNFDVPTYGEHGRTYGFNGALIKATRISGMRNFNINDFGLLPIKAATWGPFVLLNLEKENVSQKKVDSHNVSKEWQDSCSEVLSSSGIDSSLSYVCRREYTIECNWKVFCDN